MNLHKSIKNMLYITFRTTELGRDKRSCCISLIFYDIRAWICEFHRSFGAAYPYNMPISNHEKYSLAGVIIIYRLFMIIAGQLFGMCLHAEY